MKEGINEQTNKQT